MEEHIPFRLLGPRGLTPEGLAPFKVLVLADAAVLSDDHVATIRQFVRDGGAVVATGRTSMIDQKGERRASFGLADVFGADYAGPHDPGYAFIQAAASPLGAGIDARERIPIRKGFQETVSVRPGATPAARWIGPAGGAAAAGRTFALGSNDVPPGDLTDAPQALTNAIGRGRSVYFAADITGVYGKFGYPSLRRLLVNAVNWASRDGNPIVARAPLGVEVRAYRQGVRTVVQLLNYVTSQVRGSSAAGGPAAEDVIPIHDIRLEVKAPVRRAFQASSGKTLAIDLRNTIAIVTLSRLDVHEIVVLE
jgi:hypothetical protein